VPLEEQLPLVVVLAEQRHAGEKDEIEPAGRIDQRQAGVHRQVDIRIRLLARRPEAAERPPRRAVEGELGDERAALRLVDEDGPPGVLHRPDAVQHHRFERQPRHVPPRQREAAEPAARRGKGLDPLPAERRVGDDEAAVLRIDVERGRVEHAPRFRADLHDPRRGVVGDGVDGVAAAIEDVVDAAVGLLEAGRAQEGAGDVRRQAAGGAQDLDARARGRPGDGECHCDRDDRPLRSG